MGVALRTVLVTKTGRVYRTRGSSVTTCMADVTFVVIPNKQASNKKKKKKKVDVIYPNALAETSRGIFKTRVSWIAQTTSFEF